MIRGPSQLTLRLCMIAIACLGLNLWLFRFGWIAGLIGLNVSKHVLIACLCQSLGVNRELPASRSTNQSD